MRVERLTTQEQLFQSKQVIDTAFLHPWDEEAARNEAREQAEGTAAQPEEAWGLYDDSDAMVASVATIPRAFFFGGEAVPVGEIHMVGSLPEARGGGYARALIREILGHFAQRGDVFAALIPFSYSFYRKFGFELAARILTQRVPIDQLAGLRCDYEVTRLASEDDVAEIRAFYEKFASARNLAELRGDAAWAYKGGGEYGERDFMHSDCQGYTYVLRDAGVVCAYVTFIYVTGADGPFVGELKVTDIAYDSPQALLGVLGFLYRMRAKVTHVTLELPDDLDLGIVLPECEDVERTLGGHVMLRVLDVVRALELMPHPAGEGSYVVRVEDAFMPANSGAYRVTFGADGTRVERTDDAADLEVTEETLCQLVAGRINLDDARYRAGTVIHAQEALLGQVFVRRSIALDL